MLAILAAAFVLVMEVMGGILANSLALLSDAGHVFTDLAALLLSFFALRMAARPATNQKTYGFHRMEILSALVNGVSLVVVSLFIFVEAYRRLQNPQPVLGLEVFLIASVGLVGNGVGAALLHGAGNNLNLRGAFLHVAGDAISSVGVILSGLVIMVTGWWIADPLVSVAIGAIIIVGAVRLIDESVNVLLEATPRHIDLEQVVASVKAVPGVQDVHDVHIWCLTPQLCTMSSHVVLDEQAGAHPDEVRARISGLLSKRYNITHATLQMENEHCGHDDVVWMGAK